MRRLDGLCFAALDERQDRPLRLTIDDAVEDRDVARGCRGKLRYELVGSCWPGSGADKPVAIAAAIALLRAAAEMSIEIG